MRDIRTLILATLSALLAAMESAPPWPGGIASAIPDGGFECGHDWWSLERSLYLDAGTDASWLPAVDDADRPWHGARSLRIDNPRGGREVAVRWAPGRRHVHAP